MYISKSVLTLAIDTSAQFCAVCLYDLEIQKLLSEVTEDIGRGHAEILIGQIETCLSNAGKDYSDIDRIGVTKGPGSFTGVRVGLSVARGLALSLNVKSVGISTLDACEAIAQEKEFKGKMLTLLDARRDQAYGKLSDENEPFIRTYEDLVERFSENVVAVCGSGSKKFIENSKSNPKILHELSTPPIETVARLASLANPEHYPPEPLYLRSADAKPQSGFALKKA